MGGGALIIEGLGPQGRRALGHWPSEGEAMIRVLMAAAQEAESAAASEEERSKFQRLLAVLGDIVSSTAGGVLTNVLARYGVH